MHCHICSYKKKKIMCKNYLTKNINTFGNYTEILIATIMFFFFL